MNEIFKTAYNGRVFKTSDRQNELENIQDGWKGTEEFQLAMETIEKKLSQMPKKITIGELARAMPKYRPLLIDILESLRDAHKVNYVDYLPMPTLIEVI